MAARDILGWTAEDYQALVAMADRQGAPAEWFMAVMASESDMRPWAANAEGCVGLIQFCSPPVANMASLSPAQQMPYIERYYAPKRPSGGWESRAQIYQANYLPATIRSKGSDPDTVIAVRGDGLYQGTIFDHTNKGFTTVNDLEIRLQDKTQGREWQAALAGIAAAGGSISPFRRSPWTIILGGLALGGAASYLYANREYLLPARRRSSPRRRYA
jgi:hypothetical protein